MIWTTSSTLLRDTRFRGYLVNNSPLRIGSGREPPLGATVDLAILRIRYGDAEVPFIPGSSLKGVFRSSATAIAASKGFRVCSGLAKQTCVDSAKISEAGGHEVKLHDYISKKMKKGEEKEAMQAFWEKACLMCKIFGAPGYRGKIYFSDAYPTDDEGRPIHVPVGTRTGIAINRRTGAVMGGALYTVEYVEPGARFRFDIRCMNLPNYCLGLIASILNMMNLGWVRIGGFKTRGFGAVEVEDLEFENRDHRPEAEYTMKPLDELDEKIDLRGLVELRDGWLAARGERAWDVLKKLMEAWDHVKPKDSSD